MTPEERKEWTHLSQLLYRHCLRRFAKVPLAVTVVFSAGPEGERLTLPLAEFNLDDLAAQAIAPQPPKGGEGDKPDKQTR